MPISSAYPRKNSGTRFAILGSGEDEPLGEIISHARKRCLNLHYETSLPEMIEWVLPLRFAGHNDTGPMHAAAALGKLHRAFRPQPSRAAPGTASS